jgi:ABC-type multidrug transport system fused ATPase/permease subunit
MQGLVKVEERLRGSVPWSFYYRFFTGPGTLITFLMMFFIVFAQCARVISDWWLGEWSSNVFAIPENTYIWIYACISLIVGILIYIKGIFFSRFIITTSKIVQQSLMTKLLHSPLSWFDVTPTGRILARTTKDQDDLDNNLSFNVQAVAQNLLILVSSIILISIATPPYLIVMFFSGIAYYKIVKMYLASSREIKRLEANTRAQLITHLQETITGTYMIRTFEQEPSFQNRFFQRQKNSTVTLSNQNTTSRWIKLVTDVFSVITIAAAGYLGVITVIAHVGTTNVNTIGLALTWSLQVSSVMSWTLRVFADTENNMNAVVRLFDYIDNNPEEKDFKAPPPSQPKWPQHGVFQIHDASFKYRPELPLVIKSISLDIQENAKIGIVGRTGSGKSTITLGLLRIL